jgi:hypothetical protein
MESSFRGEESKQNIINNYTIINKGVMNMVRSGRSDEIKKAYVEDEDPAAE